MKVDLSDLTFADLKAMRDLAEEYFRAEVVAPEPTLLPKEHQAILVGYRRMLQAVDAELRRRILARLEGLM